MSSFQLFYPKKSRYLQFGLRILLLILGIPIVYGRTTSKNSTPTLTPSVNVDASATEDDSSNSDNDADNPDSVDTGSSCLDTSNCSLSSSDPSSALNPVQASPSVSQSNIGDASLTNDQKLADLLHRINTDDDLASQPPVYDISATVMPTWGVVLVVLAGVVLITVPVTFIIRWRKSRAKSKSKKSHGKGPIDIKNNGNNIDMDDNNNSNDNTDNDNNYNNNNNSGNDNFTSGPFLSSHDRSIQRPSSSQNSNHHHTSSFDRPSRYVQNHSTLQSPIPSMTSNLIGFPHSHFQDIHPSQPSHLPPPYGTVISWSDRNDNNDYNHDRRDNDRYSYDIPALTSLALNPYLSSSNASFSANIPTESSSSLHQPEHPSLNHSRKSLEKNAWSDEPSHHAEEVHDSIQHTPSAPLAHELKEAEIEDEPHIPEPPLPLNPHINGRTDIAVMIPPTLY